MDVCIYDHQGLKVLQLLCCCAAVLLIRAGLGWADDTLNTKGLLEEMMEQKLKETCISKDMYP